MISNVGIMRCANKLKGSKSIKDLDVSGRLLKKKFIKLYI